MQKYTTKILILLLLSVSTNAFAAKKNDNKEKGSKAVVASSALPTVQLSDEDRRLFDYYYFEALNAKSTENFGSQFDYLQYCLQLDSTNANALFEMGNLYTLLQDKVNALHYYSKAGSYDKNNFYYNTALASLYFENQQYAEAIALFKDLIKVNPEKVDLFLYLSESYRLEKDIPNAIKTLNELEVLVGLNERISIQKFQLYSAIDKKKEAYAELQKYIDKYPNETKYYVMLGGLYMRDNNKEEAITSFNKAKAIDPEDPALVVSMVDYYEQTGNKDAAAKELQSALFNKKIDVETKLGILSQYVGTLQQLQQETESVNLLFDSLMVEYPQEARLNLMLGNLLMIQKKKDEARFQFQVYTESEPTSPVGWEQLLKTVFPDSIQQSIEICKSAISYMPENSLFYFYLGMAHNIQKDYAKGLDALNKGSKVVPEDNAILLSEFYGQIGDVYHQMENKDSSFVYYDKSLLINPKNLGVLNNYSYYLSLERKNLDRAEKMSSITVKEDPTNPTFLDTYGWILFEQEAYTMAKIYLEKSVKYSEDRKELNATLYEHYGDVLYMLGDKDKALEYWEKAKVLGDSDSKTLDKKIETKTYIKQ